MGGLKPGFGRLATVDQVHDVLKKHDLRLGAETVEIGRAGGRVLAEDIVAGIDVPHFAKAAMDGYAVSAADTFGAGDSSTRVLEIAGSVSPGKAAPTVAGGGKCVEIGTGSAMPPGADSVVMVEYTEPAGEGKVAVRKAVAPGDNVIKPASDISAGETVLKAGTVLGPPQVGVLAALGKSHASVVSSPKVALFSTGPELVTPGRPLPEGRIYDVNTYTLRSALLADGFGVEELDPVPDEMQALTKALSHGLDHSDLVLLSGGSSLGSGDLVVEAFESLGKVLIHGVAVKPGKPLVVAAASAGDGRPSGSAKLMIGLPGYPMSALCDYLLFVQPYLRAAMGAVAPARFTDAVLARKHPSTLGRYEFVPVRLDNGLAHPLTKGSSSISSLSDADGFIEVDEYTEGVPEGQKVRVRLF